MSKEPRNLQQELIKDLDTISPQEAHARLAYQVGFLTAVLARIYEQDWILKNEWKDRIEQTRHNQG